MWFIGWKFRKSEFYIVYFDCLFFIVTCVKGKIEEFRISDEMYEEFKNYLKTNHFSYVTESQRALEKLAEIAKTERYYDSSKECIDKLKKDFSHSIDRDMDLFREQIASFLAEQFMQRYYYAEGVMAYKVLHDKEVEKAVGILANKDEFARLLK